MVTSILALLVGGLIVYLLLRRGRQSSKHTFLVLAPEAAPMAPAPDAEQDQTVQIDPNGPGLPSYQTASLEEYGQEFQDLANRLFRETVTLATPERSKKYKGSYSFLWGDGTTAAKIIIFQRNRGTSNASFPMLRDGVYVLLRTQLGAANAIGLAPRQDERFSYRRITEDDLPIAAQEIADMLSINQGQFERRTRAVI